MDIKGKAAIATGASSDDGIGAECAKILASRGCNVVVNYATNKAGAEKVVAHCKAAGVDAIAVQGDVSKDADCASGQDGGRSPGPADVPSTMRLSLS